MRLFRFQPKPLKPRRQFFRNLPRRSLIIFLAGVFCLFAAVGSGSGLMSIGYTDPPRFVLNVLSSGLVAVGFAWSASRGAGSNLIWGLVTFVYYVSLNRFYPLHYHQLTPAEVHQTVIIHATLITLCITLGYILFVAFLGAEGKRFFAAHTEIELAAGIQRELVPPLALEGAGFSAYGISLPSGAVGGDLFDIIPCGAASLAYVADVAGHGVKAGVLMSMIKASVRTHLYAPGAREDRLLEALNQVLYPLTGPGSYATFAFLCLEPGRPVLFSLAGHLPVFHFRRGLNLVERHSVENFPLAMFPEVAFDTRSFEVASGDLLAIVTDGLTEVAAKNGEELGDAYIEEALRSDASASLEQMAAGIIQASQQFGPPLDDRTLLLLRIA